MLEKMDQFFEKRLEGYEEHMLSGIEGAGEFYSFTAGLLPASGRSEVLDLGCGTGLELKEYFLRSPEARVTGIDLSEVTDIVVAGMGGMLIAEILEKELPLAGKNLILQPMTQAPFLRRWLCENGFAILAETPAEAGGKFYTVLNARYDGEKREADSFFAHVGRMPEALADPGKAELARRYLAHQLKKLEVILFGMGQSEGARQTAAEYRALAEQIREVLA